MFGWFDVGGRARARTAMRRMADSAVGPRLPPRARRSMAGRIARITVRAVELAIVVALIATAALAIRMSRGPIYLDSLRERVASSLQERLNGRYVVDLGQVYLMHDSWGVGPRLQRAHAPRSEGSSRRLVARRTDRPRSSGAGARTGEGPTAAVGRSRHAPARRGGWHAVDRGVGRRERRADRAAEFIFDRARERQSRRADP